MKRFLSLALTLLLLLALTVPASADMIIEPENRFFAQHRGEMTYVNRSYRVNSPTGFVTVWNAPDGSMVKGQFQNGFTMYVMWQYETWGFSRIWGDEKWIEGWVDLEQMDPVYDHIAFAREYADRITPYNGEFADFTDGRATINYYAYPGSAEVVRSHYIFEYDTMELLVGSKDSASYISSVFVDEQGLTWGFVGYMRGRIDAWFCLDDPGITVGEGGVPVRDVNAPELYPAVRPTLPAKSYVPYALVGGVTVLTGGTLVFLRRKKVIASRS